MKSLLISVFSFFCFVQFVKAQNIVVDYDSSFKSTTSSNINERNKQLIINDSASVYKNLSENPKPSVDTEKTIDFGLEPSLYKNLREGVVYNDYTALSKNMVVKDTLSKLFSWKLVSGHKEILGYECNKALVSFRGREYEAWYAPEIPVRNGPHKFHGLPGLILSIKTIGEGPDDFELEIEAKGIQFPNQPTPIENPFENDKIYSWKEFTDEFNRVYQKLNHYVKRDETGVTTIQIKKSGGIEVFVYE